MVPGASYEIVISATVDPATPDNTTLTNTTTATSPTDDPNPANNSDTETTHVDTSADLSVTKSDGVSQRHRRRRRHLQLPHHRVQRRPVGRHPGQPGRHLPGRLHARHGHARRRAPATRSAIRPTSRCALGTIAAGGNATVTVSYTVPSATTGSQTNTATVSSFDADPNGANNSASDTNTVLTSADLAVTKSDGATSVTAGDGVVRTYTISVSNGGPSDATGVSLADTFPAGFTRGTVTPDQGSLRHGQRSG